eukprot:gnl/TRDRNA2_/TRDRNA2_82865_c0_seq1.p1 gnl/TRDRNA2_/TRDRNA2_82865_c0~~gnl/TRDRNA2_/TRDRNA2_82865_c0_seq1.p1  ORF type:complete len:204 (+),score=34.80 gnl/TRDRNA2_/TRDRNA2_82865_c0_seq1:91-612(+)
MSRAIRDKSNVYRHSTRLVRKVLRERAQQLITPAPLAYRNLTGNFGLASEDPAWGALLGAHAVPGGTFTTSGMAALYNSDSYFPSDDGFYVARSEKTGKVVFELQDSDIVCVESADSDGKRCTLHSLVQAGEGTYDLPPMSVVKLEKILSPGEWKVFGKTVRRKLFIVSVTYC